MTSGRENNRQAETKIVIIPANSKAEREVAFHGEDGKEAHCAATHIHIGDGQVDKVIVEWRLQLLLKINGQDDEQVAEDGEKHDNQAAKQDSYSRSRPRQNWKNSFVLINADIGAVEREAAVSQQKERLVGQDGCII